MAYIGKTPVVGNFQICDAISVVNGQAAYTLQVGSANVIPQSANHMIVSLNGVIQKPGSSFTVSGSTMTFASNLATGDSIDFVQILGNVLDIGAPSDSTVTSSKLVYPLTTFSSTGIDDNADATAMTITSAEKIGIGETVPLGQLHVKSGDSGVSSPDITDLVIESSSSGGISLLGATDGQVEIAFGDSGDANIGRIAYNHDNNFLATVVNASEAMRINSSGNILIGTTSYQRSNREKLEVRHTTGEAIFTSTNDLSYAGRVHKSIQSSSSGPHYIDFYVNSSNTNVGSITHNNSSTSFTTSSDYRLKENIVDIEDATTRLKQLKPKRFNFKVNADTTVDGFLAHEVSSVVPEAISGEKDAVDDDGNPKYQGIDQSKLVPLLVKTIQELEARITTLENE